jgi:hypothetical protein
MSEILSITSARVDDMPLLLAQFDWMGLQPLLAEHLPTHGDGVGLSLGWVTGIWLTQSRLGGQSSAEPRGGLGRAPTPCVAAWDNASIRGCP